MIVSEEIADLYPRDPEPCDDCDTGLMMMFCYDGLRRCYRCVHVLAERNGWYDGPPDAEPNQGPGPDAPEPPLSPAQRKALREERKARERDTPQLSLVLNAPPTD